MARKSGAPGPLRVQIQTQSGCNGRCVFCPNEAVAKSGLPMGRMTVALFHEIIDELAETKPERVMLYLQNEPLNDPRLPDFVRYVYNRIPETTSLVVSNGTGLTREMGERLIDAGLRRLKISLQSLDEATNREIMGYGAQPVVSNILAFKEQLEEKGSSLDLRVSMVMTQQTKASLAKTRRFWKGCGIRLVTSTLENRGGNIANTAFLGGTDMRPRRECIRPSREMCILHTGEVVLCCVDWYRTSTVGDLTHQSVRDVWNGPQLRRFRDALDGTAPQDLPPICLNCAESAAPDRHRRGLRGIWTRLKGEKKANVKAE